MEVLEVGTAAEQVPHQNARISIKMPNDDMSEKRIFIAIVSILSVHLNRIQKPRRKEIKDSVQNVATECQYLKNLVKASVQAENALKCAWPTLST